MNPTTIARQGSLKALCALCIVQALGSVCPHSASDARRTPGNVAANARERTLVGVGVWVPWPETAWEPRSAYSRAC